jgi:type II secretory pathway pseudopilin PulG
MDKTTTLLGLFIIGAVSASLVVPTYGEVSQREQQKQAQKAYEASAQQHDEVAAEAKKQMRDVGNVLEKATEGGVVGGATGAAAGAAAGAIENQKRNAEENRSTNKK